MTDTAYQLAYAEHVAAAIGLLAASQLAIDTGALSGVNDIDDDATDADTQEV